MNHFLEKCKTNEIFAIKELAKIMQKTPSLKDISSKIINNKNKINKLMLLYNDLQKLSLNAIQDTIYYAKEDENLINTLNKQYSNFYQIIVFLKNKIKKLNKTSINLPSKSQEKIQKWFSINQLEKIKSLSWKEIGNKIDINGDIVDRIMLNLIKKNNQFSSIIVTVDNKKFKINQTFIIVVVDEIDGTMVPLQDLFILPDDHNVYYISGNIEHNYSIKKLENYKFDGEKICFSIQEGIEKLNNLKEKLKKIFKKVYPKDSFFNILDIAKNLGINIDKINSLKRTNIFKNRRFYYDPKYILNFPWNSDWKFNSNFNKILTAENKFCENLIKKLDPISDQKKLEKAISSLNNLKDSIIKELKDNGLEVSYKKAKELKINTNKLENLKGIKFLKEKNDQYDPSKVMHNKWDTEQKYLPEFLLILEAEKEFLINLYNKLTYK